MGEPNQVSGVYVDYYCILCNVRFGINIGGGSYNPPGTSTLLCPSCTDTLKKVINREKSISNI